MHLSFRQSVLVSLELIIPDLIRVMIGLAPIIPGRPVMIRHALVIPDLFLVLIGLAQSF